jgi:hypothetical protein
VDSSIIIVQSRNHEFVGIRNRRSQTLYISDPIEPHACQAPSYGKLHVGIYIAAIRDAMDRERQMKDIRARGGGYESSSSGGDKQDGHSSCGPDSGLTGNRGRGPKYESGSNKKLKEGGSQRGRTVGDSKKKAIEDKVRFICFI